MKNIYINCIRKKYIYIISIILNKIYKKKKSIYEKKKKKKKNYKIIKNKNLKIIKVFIFNNYLNYDNIYYITLYQKLYFKIR